jgi:anti-anti-sigma factor
VTGERQRAGSAPTVRITVSGPPQVATVTLSGEIDLLTVPELEMTLHKLLADDRLLRIDLQLRGLTFLDASGISAIIGAHVAAENTGRQLRLLQPLPHIRRILEIVGAMAVCDVHG